MILILEKRTLYSEQGCQVGLFEAKNNKFEIFKKSVGLEILEKLLSSWPLLKSIEVYIVKYKILPFLKQSLAIFSYKQPYPLASCTYLGDGYLKIF